MIEQVMDKINNHFVKSLEVKNFEIVSDGITGDFNETYFNGMYVLIKNSYLNDGVYKIIEVDSNKITVDETLQAELSDDNIFLYALAPPKTFIDIVNNIETYDNSTNGGIKSKRIQDMDITYTDDNSWYSVFKSKLKQYRRVYSDLADESSKIYNWQESDPSHY